MKVKGLRCIGFRVAVEELKLRVQGLRVMGEGLALGRGQGEGFRGLDLFCVCRCTEHFSALLRLAYLHI